jgi:hypothetical protein
LPPAGKRAGRGLGELGAGSGHPREQAPGGRTPRYCLRFGCFPPLPAGRSPLACRLWFFVFSAIPFLALPPLDISVALEDSSFSRSPGKPGDSLGVASKAHGVVPAIPGQMAS